MRTRSLAAAAAAALVVAGLGGAAHAKDGISGGSSARISDKVTLKCAQVSRWMSTGGVYMTPTVECTWTAIDKVEQYALTRNGMQYKYAPRFNTDDSPKTMVIEDWGVEAGQTATYQVKVILRDGKSLLTNTAAVAVINPWELSG